MFDTVEFWQLVSLAKNDRTAFFAALHALDRPKLIALRELHNETAATFKEEPWTDAMGDNTSEDAIDDVATWIVLQGEAFFEKVLADPTAIPSDVRARYMRDPFNISGAVIEVHRERFGVPPWSTVIA